MTRIPLYSLFLTICFAQLAPSTARAEPLVEAAAPVLDATATWSPDGVTVRVFLDQPLGALLVYPAGRRDLQRSIDLELPTNKSRNTVEVLLPGEWDEVILCAEGPALGSVVQRLAVIDEAEVDGEESRSLREPRPGRS